MTGTRSMQWLRIALIPIQLTLVVLVVDQLAILDFVLFPEVFPWIALSAMVCAIIPTPLRLWVFMATTMGVMFFMLGLESGMVTLIISVLFVGVCFLPIAFWAKALISLSLGGCCVLMMTGDIQAPDSVMIASVLGGIFMFRLAYYLHHQRHERPSSKLMVASYFLIPHNVLLALFPIIDFKSFDRGYLARDPVLIYQRGIRFITLGIFQHVLYRIIYMYLLPHPDSITALPELLADIVLTYMLVLRVVGTFHICIGVLGLYGFDLPPIFNNFLFASGFSDLWRRINIYWKDFIMKIVYYPVLLRIKKLGLGLAIALATLVALAFTWLLHQWQGFWTDGVFPIEQRDIVFWGVFALALIASSLLQLRSKAPRSMAGARSHLIKAIKIVGTLLFMSALWTYWNSDAEHWYRLTSVRIVGFPIVMAAVVTGVVLFALADYVLHKNKGLRALTMGTGRLNNVITPLILVLLAVFSSHGLGQDLRFVNSLLAEQLNEADQERLEAGYYERVLRSRNPTTPLADIQQQEDEEWLKLRELRALEPVDDLRENVLKPNLRITYKGALFETNSHGLRDQEYSIERVPGTWRVAIMGSSVEMGEGVTNKEVFEARIEERLRHRASGRGVEMINFAASGLQLAQQVVHFDSTVVRFNPDVVILFNHPNEMSRLVKFLGVSIAKGLPVPYEELEDIISSVHDWSEANPHVVIDQLMTQKVELTFFCLSYLAHACEQRGIIPAWVFVPTTRNVPDKDDSDLLKQLAMDAGFEVIDIDGCYDGYSLDEIRISPSDGHPNALGHRLMADALYHELTKRADLLGITSE